MRHIINIIPRQAVLLILLLAGWATAPAAGTLTADITPDPETNLTGTASGTNVQPLASMTDADSGVTFTFDKGTGTTAPAYYNNGKMVRLYKGNTFTVTAGESCTLKSIVFNSSSSYVKDGYLTADTGTIEVNTSGTYYYTWTNTSDAAQVTFTIPTSQQVRFNSVSVTYSAPDEIANLPTRPVLSQNSFTFCDPFELTITDTNESGSYVVYTLDGSEPSATHGTTYSGPITIPAGNDVTVKAVAVNSYGVSPVVTATYTYQVRYLLNVSVTRPGGVRSINYNFSSGYGSITPGTPVLVVPGESVKISWYTNSSYRVTSVTVNGKKSSAGEGKYYSNFTFAMPEGNAEVELGVDYDPSSPGDPSSELEEKFTLTTVCNPVGAGTVRGGGKYPEGQNISVSSSSYSGYKFIGWYRDGVQVSTSSSYRFAMPAQDVVLTARYIYNPSDPSDPEQPKLKRPLTVIASPSGSATFNISSSSVATGDQYNVYAYPRTGYHLTGWLVNGEPQEETSTTFRGIMTDDGAQVVALLYFDPESPTDPDINKFDPTTGALIVDHFSPGSLRTAINASLNGTSKSEVSHLIVKGVLSSNDASAITDLTSALYIDLSRTSGLDNLSLSTSSTMSAVSLSIPASTASIASNGLRGWSNLTSLECYAMVPPTVTSSSLTGLNKESCILHVPSDAIPLYEAADYWKEFTIMPLSEELHALKVNLPADCADGRYRNNRIELVNAATGTRQKYVVTERLLYTFINLQKDEQYNLYLMSQTGLQIGSIENIIIPESDVEVTFADLKTLRDASATVKTADGTDVTSQVTVEWYEPKADATLTYLRQGAALGEVPVGQKLMCSVTLPQSLGTAWQNPENMEYTVDATTPALEIVLQPLRNITLKGQVTDENARALQDASVIVNSMINGRFSTTVTAKTDRQGNWSMQLADAPEYMLTYSADGRVNLRDTVAAPAADVAELTLDPVSLHEVATARITYSVAYTPAAKANETSEASFFSDYKNVAVSAYNITQSRDQKEINVSYPTVKVLDNALKAGDKLRLTATSKTGAFADVSTEVTLGEDLSGEVTFAVTGKGGIEANFSMTENPAVTAMLYNAQGKLAATADYSEATVRFPLLTAGDYTLVSMGKSTILSGVQSLELLKQIGLTEGTDYVVNKVKVADGVVSEETNQLIPPFDENQFRYTTSGSVFSLNKASATPGNYVTLKAQIDFKPVYKSDVSDVKLIFDLPENTRMVTNSLMKGSTTYSYDLDGSRLIVPIGNTGYTEQVRFVTSPISGGEASYSASVSFQYGGRTVVQPLGNSLCLIKDIEISVPTKVAKATVPVNGVATPKSEITVYDDTEVIGRTTAQKGGYWSVDCSLGEPYNLSEHTIYAKIVTPDGFELISENKKCLYDKFAIEPKTVKMTFYNGWLKKNVDVVFDFQSGTTSSSSYMFYTATDVTFIADLTNNDTTVVKGVDIYVHTNNQEIRKLQAEYNAQKDRWIAVSNFSSDNLPVNLAMDIIDVSPVRLSRSKLSDEAVDYSEYNESNANFDTAFEDIVGKVNELSDEEYAAALRELAGVTADDNSEPVTFNSVEEARAAIAALLAESAALRQQQEGTVNTFADLSQYMTINLDQFGKEGSLTISDVTGLTAESLEEQGFTKVIVDDGSAVYELSTDNRYEFVDFTQSLHYTFIYTTPTTAALTASGRSSGIQGLMDKVAEFNKWFNEFQNLESKINECLDMAVSFFDNELANLDRAIWKNETTQKAMKAIWESDPELSGSACPDIPGLKDEYAELIKQRGKIENAKGITVKAIGKITAVLGAFFDAYSCGSNAAAYIDLWYSVPYCGCKPELSDNLQDRILGSGLRCAAKDVANIIADLVSIHMIFDGAAAAIPTGGSSLLGCLGGIALQAIKMGVNIWADSQFEKERAMFQREINALAHNPVCSNCENPTPQPPRPPRPPVNPNDPNNPYNGGNNGNNNGPTPQFPPVNPIHDPSGFVYEAVPSNRLEGVQASCYYKEEVENMYGDLEEHIELWNAEEYAQKNPLFTDANGMYQWDVPQGLWQVRFEKDGYQPTQSEWLPVPPPQLEVNIPMTKNRQPEIVGVHAYENGVEVTFDEYMDPTTVTASNLYVTASGEKLAGNIVTVDGENCDPTAVADAPGRHYATTFRFEPEQPLSMSMGEVRFAVSRQVRSYAGIPMAQDFMQTLDIEKEIGAITAPEVTQVLYGGEKVLTVDVVPFDASVGKTLHVENVSPEIFTADKTDYVIDENGQAQITLKGDLPGQGALRFTVDDCRVTGEALVSVVTKLYEVDAPVSSRASGTEVYRGTKITLSTEVPNATIYYTLDGSCPCDENNRLKYGLPIEITGDTQIKAIVVTTNAEESETAEFTYSLKRSDIDLTMPAGWTWISHNLENPVTAAELAADENVQRILSQTRELVRDPELGMVGTLSLLSAPESYKVQTSAATARKRLSDFAWNPATPISLGSGWNWLGYPVSQSMSPDEAFAPTEAENGDVIVGQNGFAQYNGESWVGTLEVMTPGMGYMYQSRSAKEVVYNTSIVSKAAALHASGVSGNQPLAVDIHKYPSVMPVIATLRGSDGSSVDNAEYAVNAFCGSECRGIGRVINGLVMMNVYGNTGDEITFTVSDAEGTETYPNNARLNFSETVTGTLDAPYDIAINAESGIAAVGYEGNIRVWAEGDLLRISGIDPADIELVEVYAVNGQKILSTTSAGESGIRLTTPQTGVYVVIVIGNGEYTYHRVAVR